ncbi:CAX5 [Symbiodinium sp. CCMP2456]|nr:CAX5 [Symbiodinium sp. CCMP2456]
MATAGEMTLHAPLVVRNSPASSRGRAEPREREWDALAFEDLSGKPALINPIKLKAMAMKMRHRLHNLEFKRPTSVPESLAVAGVESEPQPARAPKTPGTYSVMYIVGTDNLAGLKTIFNHPLSILLLACPLGIVAHFANWGHTWVFWLNFLALVPLAKILGDATEELAGSINNDTITGLLNATFGNAVEMIVAIQSIRSNLLDIVKASLLGSVLSNTLLVLGTAFLLGGLTRSRKRRGRYHSFHIVSEEFEKNGPTRMEKEQKFAVKSALISMAMLMFSCMSFALPTIFNSYPSDDRKSVLQVSRIGAVIVLSSYVAYLIFQLLTHEKTLGGEEEALSPGLEEGEDEEEDDEDDAGPGLSASCATGLMAVSTLAVAVNSEFLVDVIESVVRSNGLPESFIGVVLLPIAGNACEHASAIRFAMQDRPGLAIGIAVGSATQISLLVVPFSVIAAWFMDKPLDLDFGVLNTAVVTFCILVVLTLLLDGRSNWFKGYILCCMYAFLAVLYWYVPQFMQHKAWRGNPG